MEPFEVDNVFSSTRAPILDVPEYRFNFGKYFGKPLSHAPAGYITFLMENNILAGRPDLKIALENRSAISGPSNAIATNTPHASETRQTRPRSTSREDNMPPSKIQKTSPESRNPVRAWAENSDGSWSLTTTSTTSAVLSVEVPAKQSQSVDVYKMHFGEHIGMTLSELPCKYLLQLKQGLVFLQGSTQAREALSVALKQFPDPTKPIPPASASVPVLPKAPPKARSNSSRKATLAVNTSSNGSNLSTNLVLPRPAKWDPNAARKKRFRDHYGQEFEWIHDADARSFFGLNTEHINQLTVFKRTGEKKYWLYEVWDLYAFSTSEKSADAAMEAFMAKNKRSTRDIWAGMGLGIPCNGEDMYYPPEYDD